MVDYLSASLFSRLTYSWVTAPCKAIKSHNPLKLTHIPDIADSMKTKANEEQLGKYWEEERKSPKPSFWKCVCRTYGGRLTAYGLIYCFSSLLQLGVSLLIGVVVRFIKSSDPLYWGLLYAFAFMLASELVVICHHFHMNECYMIYLRCKVGCLGLLYRKTHSIELIHLNSSSVTGKITNIANVDLDKMERIVSANCLWIAPFFMLCSTGIQYWQLGVSGILGMLVILVGMLLQLQLGRIYVSLRRKAAIWSDSRVKLLSQLIEGIRVLKMHVWESPYLSLVHSLRSREIKTKAFRSAVSGFNLSLFLSTQAMASLVAFGSYVYMDNQLSADVVFTCVSVFVSAQFYCMYQFPFAIEFHSEFKVTCGRIGDILTEAERTEMQTSQELGLCLELETATWVSPKPQLEEFQQLNKTLFELKNVHFTVPPGQLCVIVGSVASGKSSLLMSILGELPYLKGTISRPARLNYFAQEPWILSSSVKDNIIMGRKEDHERYIAVVKMCSLESDFEAFPLGDQTEIGERGINISGGQKARIALARAIYEPADLYLLDDPLSAVDAIVSANIMQNCILGELAGRTRVLVTHQVKYAQYGDLVVVLEAGMIKSCGSYQEVKDYFPVVSSESTTPEVRQKAATNVFAAEEQYQGSIPISIYYKYLIAGFGCGLSLLVVLAIYCFVQAIYLVALRWLAYWTAQDDQENPIYIQVFVSLVVGLLVASSIRNEIVILCVIRAAKTLHMRIFQILLKTPIEFFDWNPTGVILNRFSKDIGVLDEALGLTICDTLQALFIALGAVGMIIYINPYMVILLAIMAVYYYFLLRWVLPVTRDVKRLEAVSRSPVFSLLSSTLPGLVTIRSMQLNTSLQGRFTTLLDSNLQPLFWYYNIFRWMSLRVDASASLFTSANVLLAVCLRSYMSAEDVALSLSFTLQLVTYVIWTVKRMLETDMAMVSAERVMRYTELDQEKDVENAQNYQFIEGRIEFKEVFLRYRKDFDPVLKGVSCLFPGQSKVGIVGRTGSGKSSLIQCLFRFRALDSGSIWIDGRDIASLPLAALRRQVSVLPQTPFIFSATLRANLDPFQEHTDEEVLQALALVQLDFYVKRLSEGLNTPLDSTNTALSSGQKQLLCMARVILAKNRILVLDEATANVDLDTDSLIQAMLRTHFTSQTIITVAHRIDTILDYDLVIVMQEGVAVEIGNPVELRQGNCLFAALAREGNNRREKQS